MSISISRSMYTHTDIYISIYIGFLASAAHSEGSDLGRLVPRDEAGELGGGV